MTDKFVIYGDYAVLATCMVAMVLISTGVIA